MTDRTSASYQGTLTHAGGALVFGYDFERQDGIISATGVERYNNGGYVHEQYALTPRIFLTGGVRLEHSSTFGNKFVPRAAVTFRLPTETYLRVSAARGIKEPALIENFAQESFYVGNRDAAAGEDRQLRGGDLARMAGEAGADRSLVFPRSLHRQDRVRFFQFSRHLAEHRPELGARRGAFGSAQLMRFVTLNAAYTKMYTRITNDPSPDQIGLELVRRPRNSGSISLELAPRRWTLIAGAQFVGERQDNDFVFGDESQSGV